MLSPQAKEEFEKYLLLCEKSKEGSVTMGREWRSIDTTLAKRLTDEQLLDQVSLIPFWGGWGLVCELMKRYERAAIK